MTLVKAVTVRNTVSALELHSGQERREGVAVSRVDTVARQHI